MKGYLRHLLSEQDATLLRVKDMVNRFLLIEETINYLSKEVQSVRKNWIKAEMTHKSTFFVLLSVEQNLHIYPYILEKISEVFDSHKSNLKATSHVLSSLFYSISPSHF